MTAYQEFLRSKIAVAEQTGCADIKDSDIHPILKLHQRAIVRWAVQGGRRAIFASFGLGKCHGAGTEVLMADGDIRRVEDVRVGDRLMGDEGKSREVLSLARGCEPLYRVTLRNGDSYTCNAAHIFSLRVSNRYREHQSGSIVDMPLSAWNALPGYAKRNCFKHYKVPIDFPKREIPFDPYLYGAWLGDGIAGTLGWTINDRDQEIVARIRAFATSEGMNIREVPGRGCTNYFVTQGKIGRASRHATLRFVQGSTPDGKRIDRRYLINNRAVRLKLLAGLIDTDGHLVDGCYEVVTKWAGLRDDLLFLCRSLGISVSHRAKVIGGVTYWRIFLSGHLDAIPCVTRKKASRRQQIKTPLVYGFTVTPVGVGDYYGFEIDGNRRYLLADFTVTHNTLIQLEICRLILKHHDGGKALIVTPLGIRQEFSRDAAMIGQTIRFIRRIEEADTDGLYMTNYETIRDGKMDPRGFTVVSLDEAACLRGFGGTKTFREMMKLYEGTAHYRFVATATPSPNEYIELLAYAAYLDVMSVGEAKAQPLDANILTPTGWKVMGEIQVGDEVNTADGTVTKVLGVFPQGKRQIYRVAFSDGSVTECDAEHLWFTKTQNERNNERQWRKRNPGKEREFGSERTTSQIAATLYHRSGRNHSIPLVGPIQMKQKPVALDPWLVGALIGDACLRKTSVVFSSNDAWMLRQVKKLLPDGLYLRVTARGTCDYSVTATGKQGGNGPHSNRLLQILRECDLLGKRSWEKRVPGVYLYNSVDVRLNVLRGLMDTDGTICHDGRMQRFCTTSEGLAADVKWLVQSLGGVARVYKRKTTAKDVYIVAIALPHSINPFSLPRKAERVRPKLKYPPIRFIVSVTPVAVKEAQCIAIDHPSRLYVTNDCVLTHNTRFFKRNSEKADQLTIHPHKEKEFWLWVASWATLLQKPSDLGPEYSDEGYELPLMEVRWHKLQSDHSQHTFGRDGQGQLLRCAALGVQQASAEKRVSLLARIEKMKAIVDESPEEHFLLWHDLEAERHAIKAALPGAAEVYGTQGLDEREQRIIDFSDGETRILATKPVLSGAGCNFQRHCHRAIFVGIGFKFYEFIQSLHRIHRFLQTKPVRIDLIYTEAEEEVRKSLERKWQQHIAMTERLRGIIQEYGLAQVALASALHRTIGTHRQEAQGDRFHLINDDAVLATRTLASEAVHLILTSIPFSTQYEYTPSYHDMGHNQDNAAFWRQMDFLTPDLYRVLKPGRLALIHVKDRTVPGGISGLGFQSLYPFHADAISHYQRHGFAFLGMKTIVTDVVRENNQTYRLGWSEQCKDGTKMGCGVPEYLLIFRKPPTDSSDGYADEPVVKQKPRTERSDGSVMDYDYDAGKIVPQSGYSRSRWQIDAHGFTRSNGNRLLTPEELMTIPHHMVYKRWREESLSTVYNLKRHVEIAEVMEREKRLPSNFMLLPPHSWHPDVWTDVARMRTLNMLQAQKGREMHLCPLQWDITDRCILQYTAEGEIVFDPFMGLGTVPLRAVMLGRTGWGIELSEAYYTASVHYVQAALMRQDIPMLYDLLDTEDPEMVAVSNGEQM